MRLSDVYRRSAGEFIEVVGGLRAEQAGADQVSRNLDGVTSEPWTARHVAARRGRTVAKIAVEWERTSSRWPCAAT